MVWHGIGMMLHYQELYIERLGDFIPLLFFPFTSLHLSYSLHFCMTPTIHTFIALVVGE